MVLKGKAAILREAIEDWKARGLLDAPVAERLEADVAARQGGLGFSHLLVVLAVICLGLAALTFVAANWEEMPRLARMGVLVGGLWGFWAGAVALRLSGHSWYAETCVLGACLLYGAAIMLTSQMYHIQGQAEDAIWTWALGTLIAAGAARSVPALALAVVLWAIWPFVGEGVFGHEHDPRLSFVFWIALCAALAWWFRARFVAHLVALAVAIWVSGNAVRMLLEGGTSGFGAIALMAFVAMAGLLWSEGRGRYLRAFERPALFYAASTAFSLLLAWYLAGRIFDPGIRPDGIWQGALGGLEVVLCAGAAFAGVRVAHPNTRDLVANAAFAGLFLAAVLLPRPVPFLLEALFLGIAIWTMRMGWRLEFRPLAALGVFGFLLALAVIYVLTVGSLLGTAGFYLLAGVAIFLIAMWFTRAARRARP